MGGDGADPDDDELRRRSDWAERDRAQGRHDPILREIATLLNVPIEIFFGTDNENEEARRGGGTEGEPTSNR